MMAYQNAAVETTATRLRIVNALFACKPLPPGLALEVEVYAICLRENINLRVAERALGLAPDALTRLPLEAWVAHRRWVEDVQAVGGTSPAPLAPQPYRRPVLATTPALSRRDDQVGGLKVAGALVGGGACLLSAISFLGDAIATTGVPFALAVAGVAACIGAACAAGSLALKAARG